MKRPLIIAAILIGFLAGCQTEYEFAWKEGDILFQDGDCGDFCEAIRKVTDGYDGRDFSHNGLLMQENGDWYVLEAISKGVSQTPLHEFLTRHTNEDGSPRVIVGRVTGEYQHLIPTALNYARTLIGKPYDSAFNLHNDAYYCSELIHFAFQKANLGNPIFEINPMTFEDPDTGETFGI
ncbi:YiiX/YebB-like N1pC/P60 family cysteine hydrolase [Litoribacter populi]|uniref:YiiX/YebB-like N1pC/P60 family cysteine hydrolase n=1 Tax=Litoribacter populi TaxID=2598460 RepID=UPI001F3ED8A8|nr:YiiX/YebB-like N1pC/P60 family cysteine hydrolase [Litoribacter populi]